jgi:hypothetical protein
VNISFKEDVTDIFLLGVFFAEETFSFNCDKAFAVKLSWNLWGLGTEKE